MKMAKIELESKHEKENRPPAFSAQNLSTIEDKGKGLNTFKSKDLSDTSEFDILKDFSVGSRVNVNQIHREFQVPLILSKNV